MGRVGLHRVAVALLVNALVLDPPPGTSAVGAHSLQKLLSLGLHDR